MEIWKEISGFEGSYQISNYGRVKSLSRTILKSDNRRMIIPEKILTQKINDRGYSEVKLSLKGKGGYYKVHRLVAKSFIPTDDDALEVNHKNGNKQKNEVSNLEWCTRQENVRHSFDTGLNVRKGEKNSQSIMTDIEVMDIRKRKLDGEERKSIYETYKHKITIKGFNGIYYGYAWKHIQIDK